MTREKRLARVWLSGASVVRSLLRPLTQLAVAFVVVRVGAAEIWGQVVDDLVFVTIAAQIVNWGNQEYLLRAFSRDPAKLGELFRSALVSRLPILGLASVAALLVGPHPVGTARAIWIGALFLAQSSEVLVVYLRRFGVAILADLVTALGLLAFLVRASSSRELVLWGLAGAAVLRAAILALVLFPRGRGGGLRWGYYAAALPFAALGFSGFVQTKADLWVVSLVLDDARVGVYQITVNVFFLMAALGAFALAPWVRTIYRMPGAAFRRLQARFATLGAIGLGLGMVGAEVLLNRIFGLGLDLVVFALGGLLVAPSLVYLPLVHRLYGDDRERRVLAANLVGAVLSLGLTWWLARSFGIAGALTAATIAQWTMLSLYLLAHRLPTEGR